MESSLLCCRDMGQESDPVQGPGCKWRIWVKTRHRTNTGKEDRIKAQILRPSRFCWGQFHSYAKLAALPVCPVSQSCPRNGCTYCSAMSQGKKIQVSWLTSVI